MAECSSRQQILRSLLPSLQCSGAPTYTVEQLLLRSNDRANISDPIQIVRPRSSIRESRFTGDRVSIISTSSASICFDVNSRTINCVRFAASGFATDLILHEEHRSHEPARVRSSDQTRVERNSLASVIACARERV